MINKFMERFKEDWMMWFLYTIIFLSAFGFSFVMNGLMEGSGLILILPIVLFTTLMKLGNWNKASNWGMALALGIGFTIGSVLLSEVVIVPTLRFIFANRIHFLVSILAIIMVEWARRRNPPNDKEGEIAPSTVVTGQDPANQAAERAEAPV